MANDPGSILRPVVAKIADALSDRPLAEAESVIEAARRVLWMQRFTGIGGESVMAALNVASSARYAAAGIATACASAADPLLAAERILWELCMLLYTSAYGDPASSAASVKVRGARRDRDRTPLISRH